MKSRPSGGFVIQSLDPGFRRGDDKSRGEARPTEIRRSSAGCAPSAAPAPYDGG